MAPIPEGLVGCVVIGTATKAAGCINVVVLRDRRKRKLVLWWKRNATTSGIGEWCLEPYEKADIDHG